MENTEALNVNDQVRNTAASALPGVTPMNQSMGRYRLRFELSSGGMGTVYLARYASGNGFDRVVAVKRLHADLADDEVFREMFLHEARIAARIDHPNVCTVNDFGIVDRRPYLTMQYLVGESLAAVANHARAQAEWFSGTEYRSAMVRAIEGLCEGLHAAHELTGDRGEALCVVHRDITPHNLFVLYDGSVRVTDFGIACSGIRTSRTNAGVVKGKLAYMAPEQFEGRPLDRRSDIWSMGVVLWELLAGRRLFTGNTEQAMVDAITTRPIPSLRSASPSISAHLDAVVARALARDPDQRFQTARELAQALALGIPIAERGISNSAVSAWMHRAFPDGETLKRQLVAAAQHEDEDETVTITAPWSAQRPPEAAPQRGLYTAETVRASRGTSPWNVQQGRSRWTLAALATAASLLGAYGVASPEQEQARSVAADINVTANPWHRPISHARAIDPTNPQDDTSRAFSAAPTAAAPRVEPAQPINTAKEAVTPIVVETKAEPSPAITKPTPKSRAFQNDALVDRLPDVPSVAPVVGEVYVTTPGRPSQIFVGGRMVGRTPRRVRLPAGLQSISLLPSGATTALPFDVDVHAGQLVMLEVTVGAGTARPQ